MVTHGGGCHCGRVRFVVIAPLRLSVSECNGSICSKQGIFISSHRNHDFNCFTERSSRLTE